MVNPVNADSKVSMLIHLLETKAEAGIVIEPVTFPDPGTPLAPKSSN